MINGAHGFFHSTGFVIARDVGLFMAVLFWLALGFWVYRDALRRIGDPFLVGVAAVVGLVPPYIGPVVYLLFRPSETLADARSRRVELEALEQQLARSRPTCPVCSSRVQPDYLACPVCTTTLRRPCASCDAPLEQLWQMCPYCAAPVELSIADLDTVLTAEARTNIAPSGEAPPLVPRSELRTADA